MDSSSNSDYDLYGTIFKFISKENTNTSYECPNCSKVITGSGTCRLKSHITGVRVNSNSVSACPHPNKATKTAIVQEIQKEEAKKRKLAPGQTTIKLTVDDSEVSQAILDFLVENNLAPDILETKSFSNMLTKVKLASFISTNIYKYYDW